ncbi:MFS transporter [Paramixta manurensis]|uniref:MFS transporter n=1 Tax=Paramixta manurensis TaxID=2740817 RepID=A0A6M8UA85_9GAMM|nr:MFS transporter [Erwiniaceae bacterium PD-1]
MQKNAEIAEIDPTALFHKIAWRLVPLFVLCFVVAYFDRVNISFAKLQMQSQLDLSNSAYGLGAALFFVGYLLFEIPSNLILVRVGARRWIARIMISWGLASMAMMLVHNETLFYALRFILGACEAGFVPGVVYYFTQWFTAEQRGRVNAFFFSSSALSGIIGGPLSGGVLKYMDGLASLAGWQWLFLVEGIPSLILGLVVWRFLDDKVADARWLRPAEKQRLTEIIAAEQQHASHHLFRHALASPATWLLSLAYIGMCAGVYGIFFWMPQLVHSAGTVDPFIIGLLTILPNLAALIGSVLIGRHSDKRNERRWHLFACLAAGTLGYIGCGVFANATLPLVGSLMIAMTGLVSAFGLFWTLPPRIMSDQAAAGGVALINSLGQLGGVFAPWLVGWVRDQTGSATVGLYTIAVICALTALLLTWGIRFGHARKLPLSEAERR